MSSSQISQSRVYSLRQVLIAAAIGGPLAGPILLASNYRAFGKPQSSQFTLLAGTALTLLVCLIAWLLPPDIPRPILTMAYFALTGFAATGLQGYALATTRAAGTPLHSTWRVLGVSVISLAATFFVLLVVGVVFHS